MCVYNSMLKVVYSKHLASASIQCDVDGESDP